MDYRGALTRLVPLSIYCVIAIGFVFQGFRYLFATEVMPHHLEVVGVGWETLAPNQRQLFVGLLKGFGAGSLGTGIAVLVLTLVPLRRGDAWAYVVTPLLTIDTA